MRGGGGRGVADSPGLWDAGCDARKPEQPEREGQAGGEEEKKKAKAEEQLGGGAKSGARRDMICFFFPL